MERLRSADSESGFTLIELLVVMLILGVLAAIALPVFFNQTEKASDSRAKAIAHSAQVAMETCASDNNEYDETKCDLPGLVAIEPSIPGGAEGPVEVRPEGDGYEIDVESPKTGNTFSIVRAPDGDITYPCTVAGSNQGGCALTGEGSGLWGGS